MGRRAVSFDANPLSALIGRVKTGFTGNQCAYGSGSALRYRRRSHHQLRLQSTTLGITLDVSLWRLHAGHTNMAKWFNAYIIGELCLIRYLIEKTTIGLARDAACLALSRVIIRISNQESETRYVSVSKQLRPTIALRAFLESLKAVSRRLENAAIDLQFADARYLVGDSRYNLPTVVGENSH